MSLTKHLDAAASPVRQFFEIEFPNTATVARTAATTLRGGRSTAPLVSGPGINAGRAGMAIDYLVRFALASDPCPRSSAGRLGAGMLGPDLSLAAMSAVEASLRRVEELGPWHREVSEDDRLELARISLLIATFEGVYRSRGRAPASLASLSTPPVGWQEWADIVCVEAEVRDVARVGWWAAEDRSELRGLEHTCNPTFSQSRALGGADADLITADGVLVDFKSTGTTKTCSSKELWQLCGYALADTDDEYAIAGVALWMLRWRTQVQWRLPDFLTTLAGRPVEVRELRVRFAHLLAGLEPDS